MKLNFQKFALLSAAAAGVVYSVCTLFVALLPELSVKLTGWLFHLTSPEAVFGSMRVTLTGFVGGLIEVLIYMYLASFLFAWVFNKSVAR